MYNSFILHTQTYCSTSYVLVHIHLYNTAKHTKTICIVIVPVVSMQTLIIKKKKLQQLFNFRLILNPRYYKMAK